MTKTPGGWSVWRGRLADRIDGLVPDQLLGDEVLRRRASLVLMDDLAVMVGGHAHAEVATLVKAMSRDGSTAESTLLVGGRLAREKAAAVNAVAAAWDELDEGYRPATCHGGLYTVPATIAEAESTGRDVASVLAAVIVGYEVVTAFARVLPAPKPLLLHPHATLSPIGAAASVAWLRSGRAEDVLAAVDIAATMSMAGPFGHAASGAQVRNGWPAAGAVLGFLAADFASAGLGGEVGSAFDVLSSAYGHELDHEELDRVRGAWAILDGYHKIYAACQYTHSALEAALDLVEGPLAGLPTEGIDEVVVATHPLALPLDNRDPVTTLAGKFSLPHVVAAVLTTGRTDPSTFGMDLLVDPAVAELRRRVRLEAFEPLPPSPHDRPAGITVRMVDGSVARATCLSAMGGPDRPLTDEQVFAKVDSLTSVTFPGFAGVARRLVRGADLDHRLWTDVLAEAIAP